MESGKKGPEKTKEEILAERKAKKAEKATKKSQPVVRATVPVLESAVLEPPPIVKEIGMSENYDNLYGFQL